MLIMENIKSKPLVSIIIPCYNAEQYVRNSVMSILNQTYHNLEILLTDDCSTDNTYGVLKELKETDSRVKIIRHTENRKIVYSLNELVSYSHGKYIARMDSDDISLKNRIEEQVEFLENNPDISGCGTNAFYINERDTIIGESNLPQNINEIAYFLNYYNTFNHPSMMLRAGVLKENPYSEEYLYAEDYELWCRLIISKKMKLCNIADKLLKYRVYQNQSSGKNREKQASAVCKVIEKYYYLDKQSRNTFNNIFFEHNYFGPTEKSFIENILKGTSYYDGDYYIPIIEKIIAYLLSTHMIVFLAQIVFRYPEGRKTLKKIIYRKAHGTKH